MGLPLYLDHILEKGATDALLKAQTEAEPTLIGDIARRYESTHDSEVHAWIGHAPIMKLLKDELESAGLTEARYELINDVYAISLEVKRDDLSDDKIGGIMMRVEDMFKIAVNFPNKLIIDALVNGTSELCFDGDPFFDDTHPARGSSGIQDNLLAGTGTTMAQIKTDIGSGIAALMKFKGENGEPLAFSRSKFRLVHGPDITSNVNEAIFSQVQSQTTNQAFRGMVIEPLATARLTGNSWYLCDVTDDSRRPVLFQDREGVSREVLGPGSDHYVKNERVLFKARMRCKVGYQHFANAIKMVN